MQRLLTLIRKELIELRRDPRLFAIVIVAPLVQLTLLGYAATTDVRDVPLVVADEDRSAESRALVSRFEASQNFVIADSVSSASGIDSYLDSGRAWMALVIPARYFLVILLGLLLKGVGVGLLWVDILSLAAFSAAVLALASLRLKREWA